VTKSTSKLTAGIFALIAGGLVAVQARVNSGLAFEIKSGIFAALISFGIGLLIISTASMLMSSNRKSFSEVIRALRGGAIPLFLIFAGAIGGFFVIIQSSIAGVIGVSLFSVGVVTGASLSALVLDGKGLLGLEKREIGLIRIFGTLLAISGLVVVGDFSNYSFDPLILLAFVAGVGMGFQQAMNGLFGKLAKTAVIPTLFNFLAGTLLIALALLLLEGGKVPEYLPNNPFLYIGGVVGVIFIFVQVVVLPKIGALTMGIAMLVGQLVGSVLLDWLLPIASRPITISTLLGILLAMVGAGLVAKR
jgi:transporter family-2 protein